MSGNWVKMRIDLYRHHKVSRIAEHLLKEDGPLAKYIQTNTARRMSVTRNVMRNVTVGALVTLWGVTRNRGERNGDDLLVRDADLFAVDDIVDVPGFGEALKSVGWLLEGEDGLIFPRFYTGLNVDPSEHVKQGNAERQRRYREKKRNVTGDVTVTSQSNVRIDKNRIDKSNNNRTNAPKREVVFPPRLDNQRCRDAWKTWIEYKAKKRQGYKDEGSQEAQLARWKDDPEGFIAAVDFSRANGWSGLFADSGNFKTSKGTVRHGRYDVDEHGNSIQFNNAKKLWEKAKAEEEAEERAQQNCKGDIDHETE